MLVCSLPYNSMWRTGSCSIRSPVCGVLGIRQQFRRGSPVFWRGVLGCISVGVGCWCCSIVGRSIGCRRFFRIVLGAAVGGFWWGWALRSFFSSRFLVCMERFYKIDLRSKIVT